MNLWIQIVIAFFVQELVTTNAVMMGAYGSGLNLVLMTGLFASETVAIIALGYGVGRYVRRSYAHTRLARRASARVQGLERAIGVRGTRLALVSLGFVSFNHLNAFIAAQLDMPFREVCMYLLIGDMLWYASALIIIVGVGAITGAAYAYLITVACSILMAVGFGLAYRAMTAAGTPAIP